MRSGNRISAIPSFSRRGVAVSTSGFEHTLEESRLHLSGAVFHNSFRDLVDFSPRLFQLVNRSRATTRGVEFGAALPLNGRGRLGGPPAVPGLGAAKGPPSL